MIRTTCLHGALVLALALSSSATAQSTAPVAPATAVPALSPEQARAVAELGRCKRAAYMNQIGRERVSEYLSGREALRNIEDMARMQKYNAALDAWVYELVAAFGQAAVFGLMPPTPPADRAYLEGRRDEAADRAMVAATTREANVCEAGTEALRARLAAH